MSTNRILTSDGSLNVLPLLAMVIGLLVIVYGLLVLPVSVLGGVHLAVAGLTLLLAGVFATPWAGDRFGLSPSDRRTLSLALLAFSVLLFVAFVVLGYASFTTAEAGETL